MCKAAYFTFNTAATVPTFILVIFQLDSKLTEHLFKIINTKKVHICTTTVLDRLVICSHSTRTAKKLHSLILKLQTHLLINIRSKGLTD